MKYDNQFTSGIKLYGIRLGAVWGIWLALVAAFYFLMLGPQEVLMAKMQKDFNISSEQYSLAQTAGREESRTQINKKLLDVKNAAGRFLFEQQESQKLAFQISQVAAEQKLADFTVKTITIATTFAEDEKPRISEGWLELNFKGKFNQIISFMNSLERNQPVLFIENYEIAREMTGDSLARGRVIISFFKNQPPEPRK